MALDVFISPSGYVYLNELYVPGLPTARLLSFMSL